MRRLVLAMIPSLLLSGPLRAAEKPIPLWPGKAPGQTGDAAPETSRTINAGAPTLLLSNITEPTLTIHRPEPSKSNGTAVLIFPGGGYRVLAIDLEGTEVAAWLNSLGITAIVVKYRVPPPEGIVRHTPALQDAQRALGIVRAKATELGIKPDRIGVIGFSAGGHLAAAISTNYGVRGYPEVDVTDKVSCRPDFTLLIYPAYLVTKDFALSPELKVTSQTPHTFIVMTEDDVVGVESALIYYRSLRDAKVEAEMHLYAKGGHGYGLRPSSFNVAKWPQFAEQWLRTLGVLDPPANASKP
ncbi:alpha/beta hydrolase [Isosphaeraceae bacterium EP7]